LVSFLKRCKDGLRPNGVIGIKENNASKGYVIDEEDSSVTRYEWMEFISSCYRLMLSILTYGYRSDDLYKQIFKTAGFKILKEKKQHGLPAGLFAVKM